MRRALFDRLQVRPYTSDAPIDRDGMLSAVLGIDCTAVTGEASISLAVTHCDTQEGTYEAVTDPRIFVDTVMPKKIEAVGIYQIPVDLLGCKRYVKLAVAVTGTATCTYAIATGDAETEPLT